MSSRVLAALLVFAPCPSSAQETAPAADPNAPVIERVTFDEAVRRALERNPTVGEAAQAILRAEALLDDARTVFHPSLDGVVGTTVIDAPRGFAGNVTQPRTQTSFGAAISYPLLAPARWAEKTQAADQVGVARFSAEDVKKQIGLAAAEAYFAVLNEQRQLGDRHPQPRDGARAGGVRAHPARRRPGQPAEPRALGAGARHRRGRGARASTSACARPRRRWAW